MTYEDIDDSIKTDTPHLFSNMNSDKVNYFIMTYNVKQEAPFELLERLTHNYSNSPVILVLTHLDKQVAKERNKIKHNIKKLEEIGKGKISKIIEIKKYNSEQFMDVEMMFQLI